MLQKLVIGDLFRHCVRFGAKNGRNNVVILAAPYYHKYD